MELLNKAIQTLLRAEVPAYPIKPVHELSTATLIGRGEKRDCHQHPDEPACCIKVPLDPEQPDAQLPSIVEWFCTTTLDQRGVPHTHREQCHGWVETSRGTGLVLERVRNADGEPSPTLEQALQQQQLTLGEAAELFAELRHWVLKHAVPVTDLNSGNVMVRHSGGQRNLVLVDGIGGQKVKSEFLLYQHCPAVVRRLTRRRWPQLEHKVYRKMKKRCRESAAGL